MTLADLPQICDVFTVGGTKQGALFGEAVVIMTKTCPRNFPTTSSSAAASWPRAGS